MKARKLFKNELWRFTTARFSVSLCFEYDDDVDLSWDESGETAAKIDSGEWAAYVFAVRVHLDGNEIATDYLGGSVYADPVDFYKEHIGIAARARTDGRNYGCYFTDMVRQAIDEARKTLANPPRIRATA